MNVRKELLLRMYRGMLQLRILDRKMLGLQRQGRIGFYGTVTGEEAAVIGSAAALAADDWVFPALRQGGVMLWRGWPLVKVVAQNIGNEIDLLKGRQMPCHYSDRAVDTVAWSSCIATQLIHAVGAAYAMRLKRDRRIAVGYMGDGATSENDFHAALNFAGVWKAPVVFFCQNNQWAISVSRGIQTASETIAQKAEAYGFEGVQVDGNDVLAVYEATRAAAAKARKGGGPTLVEAVTYRMGGHSSSDDPTKYRDEQEVASWRKKDPVDRFRKHLVRKKLWSDRKEKDLVADLGGEIDAAVEEAESAGPPKGRTLFEDVFARPTARLESQHRMLEEEYTTREGTPAELGRFPL